MKRSVLIFAASSMLITSVLSCKDAEENDALNTLDETQVEQAATDQPDSSKELENTDLVESGTYTGTAKIVDDQQQEVYLQINDTTTIELYFSNDTYIEQGGQQASFDVLEQGQRLEVEVERSGQSLKPLRVSVVE